MVDFSLIRDPLFESLCLKMANGIVKIDKQIGCHLLLQTSAIKPGSRFSNESSVAELSSLHGLRLVGDSAEVMKKFTPETKVEAASNELKASFKIEIEEHEKKNRNQN